MDGGAMTIMATWEIGHGQGVARYISLFIFRNRDKRSMVRGVPFPVYQGPSTACGDRRPESLREKKIFVRLWSLISKPYQCGRHNFQGATFGGIGHFGGKFDEKS